jgi:F-type H+-transporting ATPase subunit b
MINVNATILLQVIHFLILLFILNRILIQSMMRVINDREQHIAEKNRLLTDLKEETEKLVDKCTSMEKNARQDALENSYQLRREAGEIADKILVDTREEIASIRNETEKEVENKLKEARQYIQTEATTLANEIVEKIISRGFEIKTNE